MAIVKSSSNGNVNLTPNFTLAELIESDWAVRNGVDNAPNSPLVMANLYKVAVLLEQVRKLCGNKPIFISSGYRSPKVNAAVGGAWNSDHLIGEAVDFRIPAFGTPLQVAQAIAASSIKFGQLIMEGTWVHMSLPSGDATKDCEVLTAKFVNGKPVYSKGL